MNKKDLKALVEKMRADGASDQEIWDALRPRFESTIGTQTLGALVFDRMRDPQMKESMKRQQLVLVVVAFLTSVEILLSKTLLMPVIPPELEERRLFFYFLNAAFGAGYFAFGLWLTQKIRKHYRAGYLLAVILGLLGISKLLFLMAETQAQSMALNIFVVFQVSAMAVAVYFAAQIMKKFWPQFSLFGKLKQ